jgi:hypothetical protein
MRLRTVRSLHCQRWARSLGRWAWEGIAGVPVETGNLLVRYFAPCHYLPRCLFLISLVAAARNSATMP